MRTGAPAGGGLALAVLDRRVKRVTLRTMLDDLFCASGSPIPGQALLGLPHDFENRSPVLGGKILQRQAAHGWAGVLAGEDCVEALVNAVANEAGQAIEGGAVDHVGKRIAKQARL